MLEPSGSYEATRAFRDVAPARGEAAGIAAQLRADQLPVWRVHRFLEAQRAVLQGRACLTEAGAAYLGIEFRFGIGGGA